MFAWSFITVQGFTRTVSRVTTKTCADVIATCIDVIATCTDIIATCIDVIATCSYVSATCSYVIATCTDVIATCSYVSATCSYVIATCTNVIATCKCNHVHIIVTCSNVYNCKIYSYYKLVCTDLLSSIFQQMYWSYFKINSFVCQGYKFEKVASNSLVKFINNHFYFILTCSYSP